jgi:hypothetical protein
MNTTIIKCAMGQTIMIQHDVNTPRPYSRIHLLQGTEGCAQKWPDPEPQLLKQEIFGLEARPTLDGRHPSNDTSDARYLPVP